jgi:hypothetical protein
VSSTNLYAPGQPIMIDSGTFWRCRHGCTFANPCWQCGLFRPLRYVRHAWAQWWGKRR